MTTRIKKAAPGGKPSRTVGLDLGDKFCHYSILDGEGEVMEEGRVKTEEGVMRKHFENEEPMGVAMEFGTHSPWSGRLPAKLGHEVIVANARRLKGFGLSPGLSGETRYASHQAAARVNSCPDTRLLMDKSEIERSGQRASRRDKYERAIARALVRKLVLKSDGERLSRDAAHDRKRLREKQ